MRVFVTRNIDLERDLSNGARGVITDVLLHREESSLSQEEPLIHLQHPPAVVFVRLDKTRAGSLPGLESKVVPIEPIQRSFRINFQDTDGGRITRTVHETQLPITAAYVCTDYRAQGQTLSSVIVDISFPPHRSAQFVQFVCRAVPQQRAGQSTNSARLRQQMVQERARRTFIVGRRSFTRTRCTNKGLVGKRERECGRCEWSLVRRILVSKDSITLPSLTSYFKSPVDAAHPRNMTWFDVGHGLNVVFCYRTEHLGFGNLVHLLFYLPKNISEHQHATNRDDGRNATSRVRL